MRGEARAGEDEGIVASVAVAAFDIFAAYAGEKGGFGPEGDAVDSWATAVVRRSGERFTRDWSVDFRVVEVVRDCLRGERDEERERGRGGEGASVERRVSGSGPSVDSRVSGSSPVSLSSITPSAGRDSPSGRSSSCG